MSTTHISITRLDNRVAVQIGDLRTMCLNLKDAKELAEAMEACAWLSDPKPHAFDASNVFLDIFEWLPCSANEYYEMLGCVPPQVRRGDATLTGALRGGGGFLVGEPMDHRFGVACYVAYWVVGRNYFKGSMPISEEAFALENAPK